MSPTLNCGVCAVLCVGLMLFGLSAQAHDSWLSRNSLRNGSGEWCCGEGDCGVVDRGAVTLTSRGYEIHGNVTIGEGPGAIVTRVDELVPTNEVQPSPDGAFWRCKRPDGTRRCFFAPPPGS